MTPEPNTFAHGMTEKEAIEGAKLGDPRYFETLYYLHRRHVYRLCLRITRNTAEAEDLTQDVFLQLFRKVATFRGDSAFSTWLHRVAVNEVLAHMRRNRNRAPHESLESQREDGVSNEIGAPDNRLAVSVDRIVLQRLISLLPPGYRIIFVLHDVEGFEHKEIARMMRCSVGNSKSQLHKARLKLRSHLQTESACNRPKQQESHTPALAA